MKLKCLRCGVEWDHWQAAGIIPTHGSGSGDDLCPNGGRVASADTESVLWERADPPPQGGTGVVKPKYEVGPTPGQESAARALRDQFAMATLAGILAGCPKSSPWPEPKSLAATVYDYANAMMAERAKRDGGAK